MFEKFGELHSCPFFPAREAGKHPYGFANFERGEDAQRALEQLDRQVVFQEECCCRAEVLGCILCTGREWGVDTSSMVEGEQRRRQWA